MNFFRFPTQLFSIQQFFSGILLLIMLFAVNLVNAATPFECSPTLYQVLNVPDLGQLNVLDPATESYVPIGTPQGGYNATGYNPRDNFIYGLDSSGFVQIDADNNKQTVTLNLVNGNQPAGAAGDFDTSGNYVGGALGELWLINNIDPINMTADSMQLTVSKSIESSDLVYVAAEDLYYGVGGGSELHIVDVDEVALTATVTDVPLAGLGTDTGAFGAAWADDQGVLLFYNNLTGHIWEVRDYTTPNPVATLLLTTTSVSSNDGMSCGEASLLGDNDSDGVPDVFDADNDNDGIPNLEEGYADADGDGIANAYDLDSDNDGIPDSVEFGTVDDSDLDGVIDGLEDVDGDTIPDVCDIDQSVGTDSDADQIIDSCDVTNTGGTDTDGDGIDDTQDADVDGDGLADTIDPDQGGTAVTALDTDSDGVPDVYDLDADNDGIPDSTEAGTPDVNGDGITDSMEGPGGDTDSDGLADVLDSTVGGTPVIPVDTGSDGSYDFQVIDSDGDTIPDTIEADVIGDNNADGILDTMEDADLDSIPDSADVDQTGGTDTDGDGIDDVADVDQTGGTDTDGDSIDDAADPDADGNGFADGNEPVNGGAVPPLTDTDTDGTPDYRDLDSDGDTIPDAVELTDDPDADGDGNYRDTDSDADGLDDTTEAGADPGNPVDTDGNGTPDYLQNDDVDADGIPDDIDLDDDNDGIPDTVEGNVDTDGDGVPDRLDLDSDNDGIYDLYESGADAATLDTDNDGRIDTATFPVGANGLADAVETVADSGETDYDGDGSADVQTDTDADGISDFRDLDSDNDGLNDVTEAGGDDPDGDGILGTGVPVVDANGLTPGAGLAPRDTDNDGTPDFRDLDSDSDGLNDVVEAGHAALDTDGDGIVDGADSDGDGITDAVDGGSGFGDGSPDTVIDSDGDGIPDYRDNGDVDGDGIFDEVDLDNDNDGIPDTVEGDMDSDGDGIVDRLDLDSDNDGIYDLDESGADAATLDTDNDGRIDTATFPVGVNGLADAVETAADSDETDYDGDGSADTQLDTDGDLLPDFLDLDSDNDGITDVIESAGDDPDNDGMTGSGTPVVDGNGLSGAAGVTPPDSDTDGIPDFRDLDSDNDAILDNIEAQASDATSLPTGSDTDGDGLDDAYDSDNGGTAVPLPDTDGDTVPDYLDIDSDADSANDIVEAGMPDTNSDGVVDSFTDSNGDGLDDAVAAAPVVLLDENSNGIPDYREAGVQAGVCQCQLETGIDGHGGAVDWWLLGLLAIPAIFRRRLRYSVLNNRIFGMAGLLAFMMSPVQLLAENSPSDRDFNQRFYLGANAGVSKLEPESSCGCYAIDDDSDTAFSLFLGMDLSPRFTLEGYYSELGEAGIESTADGQHAGELEYQQFGLSLLGYVFNSKNAYDFDEPGFDDEGLFRREGLSAFGRIGVGGLNNDSDLEFEKQNSAHLHLGLGLEYGWSNGIAARAEYISFDKDTKLLAIGLLKRFGHINTYAAIPVTTIQPEPEPIAPVVAVEDEVVEPPTVQTAPVVSEENTIASRDGEPALPVVYFEHDRKALTKKSAEELTILAENLKENTQLVLEVRGHTDSRGSDAYNLPLSEKRANQVKAYLIGLGVSPVQLQVKGYGEATPIADNETVEGRDINRRVDFSVIEK